jgi:hypothetical protein
LVTPPVPLMGLVTAMLSERLNASVASLTTPALPSVPVVPPLPICRVPALMVVRPA